MRIREVLRSDLVSIIPLYARWLEEQKEDLTRISYPFRNAQVPQDYGFYLMQVIAMREKVLDEGRIFPWEMLVVIPQGNVVKGFLECQIEERVLGSPKRFARCLNLFVDPKSRGQGIFRFLFKTFLKWGTALGAEAFEVSCVPGSEAHKIWASLGARSYSTQAVIVNDSWQPIVEEGEIAWPKHTPVASPIGSMETKAGPMGQLEFTLMPNKDKKISSSEVV